MNELLEKYRETFGEQFPLMLVRGMSEKEITAILKGCLDEGKPYELNPDDEADY